MFGTCTRLLGNTSDEGRLSFVRPSVFPREAFSSLLPFNVHLTAISLVLVEGVMDNHRGDVRLTHTAL